MICTAVSVLPVPGGPTTIVSPGCVPALIASTCSTGKTDCQNSSTYVWRANERMLRQLVRQANQLILLHWHWPKSW